MEANNFDKDLLENYKKQLEAQAKALLENHKNQLEAQSKEILEAHKRQLETQLQIDTKRGGILFRRFILTLFVVALLFKK
jgi:histidinol dehydrogenase